MINIGHRPVTLRDLFGVRAFAVVATAGAISVAGSQLARLALSVLVFDRTGSATAGALTYATTFLPAVLGGVLLGRLGDRYPKRAVMVSFDVIRAVLYLAMAIPHLPVPAIIALLVVAVFLDPGFTSAEVSYLAEALPREMFRASSGFRATGDQAIQVLAFGAGGLLIATVSPGGALVIDAATFLLSALALTIGLSGDTAGCGRGGRHRAAPEPVVAPAPVAGSDSPPFRGLWRDPRTRLQMLFTVVVALYVFPEALAVPYGNQIGVGTARSGVLLALIPLGSAIGALLIVRVRPAARRSVTAAFAVLAGLPLTASALEPTWWVSGLCWVTSGLLCAYQVEVIAGLVAAIPPQVRSTQLGAVGSWLIGAQGAVFAAGGALAGAIGPGGAIALVAGVGAVIAASAAPAWLRHRA